MPFATPVVLLLYRRPETTRRVVEQIAALDPETLLVVADGPRDDAERLACEQARDAVRQTRWRGRVIWNAADANMGMRKRVSSGLDWAFSLVEEAVIVEDDCLPAPSFFPFCEALLARYRDDPRVMCILGSSNLDDPRTAAYSYSFSKYFCPWGWATWRRSWRHYDEAIAFWPEVRESGALAFDSWVEKRYWTRVFDRLHDRELQTWDYQWLLTMWCNHGLAVLPSVNLTSNIGCGPGGTHLTSPDHPHADRPVGTLEALAHPLRVMRSVEADLRIFKEAQREPPLLRLARVELGGLRARVRRRLRGWRESP